MVDVQVLKDRSEQIENASAALSLVNDTANAIQNNVEISEEDVSFILEHISSYLPEVLSQLDKSIYDIAVLNKAIREVVEKEWMQRILFRKIILEKWLYEACILYPEQLNECLIRVKGNQIGIDFLGIDKSSMPKYKIVSWRNTKLEFTVSRSNKIQTKSKSLSSNDFKVELDWKSQNELIVSTVIESNENNMIWADDLFGRACKYLLEDEWTPMEIMLKTQLNITTHEAQKLMKELEEKGIVGVVWSDWWNKRSVITKDKFVEKFWNHKAAAKKLEEEEAAAKKLEEEKAAAKRLEEEKENTTFDVKSEFENLTLERIASLSLEEAEAILNYFKNIDHSASDKQGLWEKLIWKKGANTLDSSILFTLMERIILLQNSKSEKEWELDKTIEATVEDILERHPHLKNYCRLDLDRDLDKVFDYVSSQNVVSIKGVWALVDIEDHKEQQNYVAYLRNLWIVSKEGPLRAIVSKEEYEKMKKYIINNTALEATRLHKIIDTWEQMNDRLNRKNKQLEKLLWKTERERDETKDKLWKMKEERDEALNQAKEAGEWKRELEKKIEWLERERDEAMESRSSQQRAVAELEAMIAQRSGNIDASNNEWNINVVDNSTRVW